MKILITGAFSSLNKGDESRVKSSIEIIRKTIDSTEFGFYSSQVDIDRIIYKDINIDIIDKYNTYNKSGGIKELLKGVTLIKNLSQALLWRISSTKLFTFLDKIEEYDVFMDLSGESLSDYFGKLSLFVCLYPIILGILKKKKVIIFAQSIGPFENYFEALAIRLLLNHCDLITTRDEVSFNYLKKYNIKSPNYLCADPAFLLQPAPPSSIQRIIINEGIDRDKTLVGIAIGRGSFKRGISRDVNLEKTYLNFINVIGSLIDYTIEKMDADIIFIPHVLIPNEDDRIVYKEIKKNVINKERFKLISAEYSCQELKGLIGNCDLFIGSRMHANIAAVSSLVPTIAIAYSHKMPSLMKMLGQENYVLDIAEITLEELKQKVDDLWTKRSRVQAILKKKVDILRQRALLNAELLRDTLVDS